MPHYHSMKPLRLIILLAIGAVLIATLVSFVNRWKGRLGADNDALSTVKPLAGEVDQQTRAFSLAKTEGDHTLYTIKADQVTTLKDTQKNLLHGVVVEIFGKSGLRHDRITTAECEYDPIAQTLWVPGKVEMSFELPTAGARPGNDPQRVVIHTSRLSFDQSTGNAATDAPVDFTFPQGAGRSLGARYDSQQQTLHMVSAVEFVLKGQPPQAIPTTIQAGELRYFRNEGRLMLDQSVDIVKGTRRVQSQSGTVWLDEQNQVRRAELHGDVQGVDSSEAGPASVRSRRANLDFADGSTIRTVDLLDAVNWQVSEGRTAAVGPSTPLREGQSQRMLLTFSRAQQDASKASELEHAAATGKVQITLRARDRSSVGHTQVLTGEQADLNLAPGGRMLRSASLRGSPKLEMHEVPDAAPRVVTAGTFDFAFSHEGELTQFAANQNVRVVSPVMATAKGKADTRVTTSENLLAQMDPVTGKLKSLRQAGNFTYQDSARRAQAAAALYQAEEESISLERSDSAGVAGRKQPQPSIVQPEGRIAANTIKILMRSGDLEAAGAVATTSTPSSKGASPPSAGDQPVHAVADKMRYDDAAKVAHYSGRVRLWQGTEFLLESEAASLDRQNRVLTATGRVQTIFRPAASPSTAMTGTAPKEAGKAPATYVIRADQVSYTQATGEILYSGSVRVTTAGGSLTSKTLEILLKRAGATADYRDTALRIEKMIARGEVIVSETGREGRGDTADYLADTKVVNLYGQPATLYDLARGSTKGVQLTYQIGDNRSAVVGTGAEQTETRWLPTK